jgi:hypothetical protein
VPQGVERRAPATLLSKRREEVTPQEKK